MILYINTTKGHNIEISVKNRNKMLILNKFKAQYKQAERLLPEIDKMLKKNRIKLADINKIKVVNCGGSFTSLRIGVVTANALGYALGILVKGTVLTAHKGKGVNIIEPVYEKEPNIT